MLCDCHLCLVPERSHQPQRRPGPSKQPHPAPPPALAATDLLCLRGCTCPGHFHGVYQGLIPHCGWTYRVDGPEFLDPVTHTMDFQVASIPPLFKTLFNFIS